MVKKLNKIRVVLAEQDKSNKWLADKLGKGEATVSKWVTNKSQPTLANLIDIAKALNVKVGDLIRQ